MFLTSPGPTGHLLTVKTKNALPMVPKQMLKPLNLSSIFEKISVKTFTKPATPFLFMDH